MIETESDANYLEDIMNMSINLDRLPKEMIASNLSQYDWKGRKSPGLNDTQYSMSLRDKNKS